MCGKIDSLLSVMLTLATAVTLCGQGQPSDASQTAQTAPTNLQTVQSLSPGHKIKVVLQTGERARGAFVSASDVLLVMRSEAGERSIRREDIRRVRVYAPSRRTRNGLIATAIGAGVGLAIGFAICPQCSNEGAAGKYTGPFAAAAAGVGAAIGFLPAPYRTVYKSN